MWPGWFPKECNQDVKEGEQEELVDRVVTSSGLYGVRVSWDWPDRENLLVGLSSEAGRVAVVPASSP